MTFNLSRIFSCLFRVTTRETSHFANTGYVRSLKYNLLADCTLEVLGKALILIAGVAMVCSKTLSSVMQKIMQRWLSFRSSMNLIELLTSKICMKLWGACEYHALKCIVVRKR
jgi:hypothetical protein